MISFGAPFVEFIVADLWLGDDRFNFSIFNTYSKIIIKYRRKQAVG
jgi:hypothetical protein